MRLLSTLGLVAVMAGSMTAQAPAPLPMGAPAQGKVGEGPTDYAVAAKTAGVLSVAVQGTSDLSLQLVDEDGQILPDGFERSRPERQRRHRAAVGHDHRAWGVSPARAVGRKRRHFPDRRART